jgi:uncharacterized protein
MKLTLKHAVAAIIVTLSLAGTVAAGPREDAIAAFGRGDYATALRFFRPRAEQGDTRAQAMLGGIYYLGGHGVPPNYSEALKWFRLATDQPSAQNMLGNMYANGQGVPQNYVEAAKWYRLAANQGQASAQYNLGRAYIQRKGVPKDYVSAHMWINLSAAQGDQDAAKLRDSIARLMTPSQIAEAQKLASEWKPTRQPSQ